MPYETRYRTVSTTLEQNLGYDLIPVCRPRFVFFQFVGLRPSTPHWIFFDGIEVTKWVNTSYTLEDFNNSSRNSTLRTPGEQFLNATSFPASLGGPTAASGPINTDATGKLEGVFYIQSNASLSFKIGRRKLSAIDISVLNKNDCLSYAEAEYSAIGEYQLYYTYTQTSRESYQVWVEPEPEPDPPDDDTGGDTYNPVGPINPVGPVTPSTPSTPIDTDKGSSKDTKSSSSNDTKWEATMISVHTVSTTTTKSNTTKNVSSSKNDNKQDIYEGGPFAGAPVSAGPSTISSKTSTATSKSNASKDTSSSKASNSKSSGSSSSSKGGSSSGKSSGGGSGQYGGTGGSKDFGRG